VTDDLTLLAGDLEARRLEPEDARRRAAQVPPSEQSGEQVTALMMEAAAAYSAGRAPQASAIATVLAAVTQKWAEMRSRQWSLQGGITEGVFDVRARALALLGYLEADAGRDGSARELHRQCDQVLARLKDSAPARVAIGSMGAERALRNGRAQEAVGLMQESLRLPGLDDSRRAAAQVMLAAALRKEGRRAEGIANLEDAARNFVRAGMRSAALEADSERGAHLLEAGDKVGARSLMTRVADEAATIGHHALEANTRLRLGVLVAEAGEHAEAARQFQLAAAAARREGDNSKVIVGLRNAADELRMEHDFAAAERLLDEALAIDPSPSAEIDLAKARVVFAVLRRRQDRRDDATRLLDEAEETFKRRLAELAPGDSERLRRHLEEQLQQVASVREKI
jgi:tetratricopeptide (TPR) repeat protein